LLVAGELADHLRQGFLSVVAPNLVALQGDDVTSVSELASKMGLPALVRAIEALGTVQVEMREAPDPRLHVEVCLLRLTRPEVDDSVQALLERVDRLERALASGTLSSGVPSSGAAEVPPAATPAPAPQASSAVPEDVTPSSAPAQSSGETSGGADMARRSLGALRREAQARKGGDAAAPVPAPAPAPASPSPSPSLAAQTDAPAPAPAPDPSSESPQQQKAGGGTFPSRDELVQVWGDGLLASLPQRPRARFRVGRFLEVDSAKGVAVFALPNEAHRSYCEEVARDVEIALSTRFGVPIKLRLIIDPDEQGSGSSSGPRPARRGSSSGPAAASSISEPPDEDEEYLALMDPEVRAAETELAGDALSAADRLKIAFPGAEEV
ncbi:MAG: hypothetical protein WAM97_01935, partial [Acidimicrobiales bacterium]